MRNAYVHTIRKVGNSGTVIHLGDCTIEDPGYIDGYDIDEQERGGIGGSIAIPFSNITWVEWCER